MNKLKTAIEIALREKSITQTELSKMSGVRQSDISKLFNGLIKRVSHDTLNALCNCWEDPMTGLRILSAHLEDEVELSGRSLDEIEPVIKGNSPAPELDTDLKLLQEFLYAEPDLRGAIHLLADTARSALKPHIVKKETSPTIPLSVDISHVSATVPAESV